MKALDEQDHYEVLEVTRNARRSEIDASYRVAQATYADGSLATYSVFDEADVRAISERIELAYEVLSDEESREKYDLSLGVDRAAEPREASVERTRAAEDAASEANTSSAFDAFEGLEHSDTEDGDGFEGARLRRLRLRRGIELEQISEITKISPAYLRCIENEIYADLPAEVYARGFVTAYVQSLGADPGRIVPDFLEKYRKSRGRPHRGFLLAGS